MSLVITVYYWHAWTSALLCRIAHWKSGTFHACASTQAQLIWLQFRSRANSLLEALAAKSVHTIRKLFTKTHIRHLTEHLKAGPSEDTTAELAALGTAHLQRQVRLLGNPPVPGNTPACPAPKCLVATGSGKTLTYPYHHHHQLTKPPTIPSKGHLHRIDTAVASLEPSRADDWAARCCGRASSPACS